MTTFTVALTTVGMMLLYAVPGFIFVKTKKIGTENIASFAVVLLFLCAPFQILDAIQRVTFTGEMLKKLALTFAIAAVVMSGMLAIVYLITRKKQSDPRVRICTAATAFGNTGFMGIPLLEALLPEYPEAVAYASAFFIAMNLLMWTVGSAIITRDRKYVRLKKVLVNPTALAFAFSMILFFGKVKITGQLSTFIVMLSKMSTVLCMLILGMRLAAIPLKPMLTSARQYVAVGVKLIVLPLIMYAICSLIPMEANHRLALYIISCVPVGNVVLSLSEILGSGQDTAANVVLLSTLLSVITIPLMLLII